MTGTDEPVRTFTVWQSDRLALRVSAQPGVLTSISAPPPLSGTPPVTHPVATAAFFQAETEGQLGALLREASDLESFLDAALAAGYRVDVDDA